jgi:hypothetical protein
LKAALALTGIRLDPTAATTAVASPETIDLELPHRIPVAAPVVTDEPTPYVLAVRHGRSVVETPERALAAVPVHRGRPARFADRTTRQGTPMGTVAKRHGHHLVVSPGGTCGFSTRGAPCPFCLEGARAGGTRAAQLHPTDVVEAVRAAVGEGGVEVVYFNSSAFGADDGGIAFLAPYVEAVRRHVDALIAVQVHPPADPSWVDRTYALGVDAVSYNLEIFDPDVLLRHCVGRARYVGRERYLDVLARAARVFPNGAVWSELVAGIEPLESTMAGIDALAGMGVVPVVVVHRGVGAAANGRLLEDIDTLLGHLAGTVARHGVNPGWVHGLPLGISPLEAALDGGGLSRWAQTIQLFRHHRPGAFVLRNLARFRRRLRVRKPDDTTPGGH